MAPKKVGPLYLLAPLLITSGSELTLFTFPLLIASPHYMVSIHVMAWHVFQVERAASKGAIRRNHQGRLQMLLGSFQMYCWPWVFSTVKRIVCCVMVRCFLMFFV